MFRHLWWLTAALALFWSVGVRAESITLYTSVDEPMARKVVAEFEKRTGHRVRVVTDTEASKSVGLAERIRAERDRPRADVWWGNEIFYTIGLADEGLLEEMNAPVLDQIDARYVDKQKRFAGVALRARVLATSAGTTVTSLSDLTDPRFKGQLVMARPSAGTTGGQVAALYTLWGRERFEAYFRALKANQIALVGGNSVSAQQVADGRFQVGFTDNDDVASVNAIQQRVEQVIPDQGDGQMGTLAIPTTVAQVKKPDRSPAATELAAFLLSKETEQMLIDEKFALASTHVDAEEKLHVRVMDVEFVEVAKNLKPAIQLAIQILEGE
jgi:iron(III) transport system substrate-binding protein